jgi:hypothetical protein
LFAEIYGIFCFHSSSAQHEHACQFSHSQSRALDDALESV